MEDLKNIKFTLFKGGTKNASDPEEKTNRIKGFL